MAGFELDLRQVNGNITFEWERGMASPLDPDELKLVEMAITSGTSGCCEWDSAAQERFRRTPSVPGLTPEWVRAQLQTCVSAGQSITQVVEQRDTGRTGGFLIGSTTR